MFTNSRPVENVTINIKVGHLGSYGSSVAEWARHGIGERRWIRQRRIGDPVRPLEPLRAHRAVSAATTTFTNGRPVKIVTGDRCSSDLMPFRSFCQFMTPICLFANDV